MIPLPSLDYDYFLADHPFTDSKQTLKPGRPRKRSKCRAEEGNFEKKEGTRTQAAQAIY